MERCGWSTLREKVWSSQGALARLAKERDIKRTRRKQQRIAKASGTVTHVQFLCLCRKLIQHLPPFVKKILSVIQNVFQANSAVAPDRAEWSFPFFEHANYERTRDIQKVGRLSGSQLSSS
jgi:hypothetical protein